MFTLKLATGETFFVNAAEQLRSQFDGGTQSRLALRVEATPADHDLDWYLENLDAPGALDTVQVLCENGSVGLEVQGYSQVSHAALRMLASGEKSFSLTLVRSLAVES